MAVRRLKKELKDIQTDPPANWSAEPIEDDIFHWKVSIIAPPNTPYDGGVYFLDVRFPQDYPFKPPKLRFETPIYHCNINDKGNISINILKANRSPALTISNVLVALFDMMEHPNPDDALVPEIGKLYKNNRKLHDKNANQHAVKFAKAKKQLIFTDEERYTMIHTCLSKIFGGISYPIIEPIIIKMDGEHENYLIENIRGEKEKQIKQEEKLQKRNKKLAAAGFATEKEMEDGKISKLKDEIMKEPACASEKGCLFVKSLSGKTLAVHCDMSESVLKFKCRIMLKQGVPIEQQRLIFCGKQLEDNNKTLKDYLVSNESTIHLVLRLR